MPGSLTTQLPFSSPQETISELLDRLSQLTPLKTWIFAEVKNDFWIIRACTDTTFGLKLDQFLSWSESLCRSVISMGGPQCAPDLAKVSHLAKCPIAATLGIASYLGVPLKVPGKMEGMLCGIDRQVADEKLEQFLPLAETFGRLLASSWDQHLAENQQNLVMADVQTIDSITGLYDLDAFRKLLQNAAEHHQNEQGGILLFDLDVSSSGNEVGTKSEITIAANLLQAATRPQDGLAHLTPGEFAIYLPGISEAGLLSVARRIRSSLTGHGLMSKWGASWFKNMHQLDDLDHAFKRASSRQGGHTPEASIPA
ncbi:diguanylate cyclase domain-containing protein [Xanthomonas arboricola]|uniref:diguanylate cyclase domain-containing protein n=1 Tax=Xanthomonas arboricola TaxID=56448 RepID=UPI0009BB5BBD|nr:diguanylate cyclase [Xanthomonas arboricola]